MNTRVLLAALAAAVVAFLAGWLIYGILLMGFFEANTQSYEGLIKEEMNFLLMFLSNLSWSLMLAFVYNKFGGKKTLCKAVGFSALIGALISLGVDLMFLSSWNYYTNIAVVVDVIATGVMFAAMGVAIGLIIKSPKS